MTASDADVEAQVLAWFERALDQPAPARAAWLAAQALPAAIDARVRRLIAADDSLGTGASDFLDAPAVASAGAGFLAFPQAGDRVGAWRLDRELDAGGMGVVFLAHRDDARFEQQVALKLVRPLHLGASPEFRARLVARFANERRLLARLSHPNVARILDGGETGAGVPWLVTEYVDGAPVTDWCDARALDLRARMALFAKVCDGVEAAHRHLVLHRDLKPDNILVDAGGEPKLLDFGIARLLAARDGDAGDGDAGDGDAGHDDGATMLTAMTPAYASPEQVRRQPLTTASDVYSLGVLLHRLLAGARPYALDGLSPAQAERVVCEARHRGLRESIAASPLGDAEKRARSAQVTPEVERIVARAMHVDAARRYPTAQALADDVRRWLDGRPVQAHPDSRGYRLRKFVGRHRGATVAATVAIAAVLASAGVAAWQARAARQSAADMRQVNAFLMDVLELADPYAATEETTLAQALDDAATRIDRFFPGRPDLSADVRFAVGYSMLARYRLDAAEAQLVRAQDEALQAFGPDDLRTIRVMEAVAGLRMEQGRNDEAVALMRDAIARIEANGLQRDPVHFMLLNNLGNLYLMQEAYPDADAWLRRAAAEGERLDVPPADRAAVASNLAQAVHGLGDLDSADTLYRDAQALYAKAHPQGSPDAASVLNNRASLAIDRGDREAALALNRESLAMRRKVFRGDHPMVASAQAHVAQLVADLGDPAAARDDARAAAAMADRVHTTPNSRHASIWATVASVEAGLGDADAALAALRRADAIMATVQSPVATAVERIAKARAKACALAAAAGDATCAATRGAGSAPAAPAP